MKNKKLGIVFLIIGIIIAILIMQLSSDLNQSAKEIGCFTSKECEEIESNLSIVHFAFGIIGFILALGFYLIFFSKSEEEILRRLEETKKLNLENEKFNLILLGLDQYEQKVMRAVKEQDGITQNTLQIRTGMSKAKLSYVVNALEKKSLISRVKKGKTYAIHLKNHI